MKAKGLTSPYLKAFVVARINYIRFSKATEFDFDEVIDKMTASAKKFNVEKMKQEDVAKAGGGGAPARRRHSAPTFFRFSTVYVR